MELVELDAGIIEAHAPIVSGGVVCSHRRPGPESLPPVHLVSRYSGGGAAGGHRRFDGNVMRHFGLIDLRALCALAVALL